MKEATGELNMTVVTVVAIAAVAAFFYAFVWPSIKTSIDSATKCSSAICPDTCTTGTCECTYYEGSEEETVHCKVQNEH
ncbi:MAG: hypothetical protein ACI4WW_02170 [Candidatus Coprovivens sp.]